MARSMRIARSRTSLALAEPALAMSRRTSSQLNAYGSDSSLYVRGLRIESDKPWQHAPVDAACRRNTRNRVASVAAEIRDHRSEKAAKYASRSSGRRVAKSRSVCPHHRKKF